MKYYLINIQERNGEQEYRQPYLVQLADDQDITLASYDVLKDWYGEDNCTNLDTIEEDGYYEYFGGSLSCKDRGYDELTKEEYEILNKYI